MAWDDDPVVAPTLNAALPLVRRLEGSADDATSPAGARGRYQIMPATARAYGFDPDKLNDPHYNTVAASRILDDIHERTGGRLNDMLVLYNASPAVYKRWVAAGRDPSVLPAETRKYLAHAAQIGGTPAAPPDAPATPAWAAADPVVTQAPKWAAQDPVVDTTHRGFLDEAGRIGGSLIGGAVSGTGKLLHNAAELADVAEQRFGLTPPGANLSDVKPAAQIVAPATAAIQTAGDQIAPTDRSGVESFAHGAGEMVPALGAAVVDPALGAVAFGATGYGESHDEALAKGMSEDTAVTAGLENAGVQGALGVVPAGELLKPLAAGVKGAIPALAARMGLAATGDAALGAAMQTGTNIVAKQNYDPNRPWYDQVPQSAAMMAAGGVAVHGAHEAVGAVRGALRPAERPAAVPEAQAGEAAAPDSPAAAMPVTDAIRAYAGKGPLEPVVAEPDVMATTTAPQAAPLFAAGDKVLFNAGDHVARGEVVRTTDDVAGPTLTVSTPAGDVAVPTAQAVALPGAYETARVAHGAPLEQMPQAIADVSELRNAAPRGQTLFQAIRDLGGVRTKGPDGAPTEVGDVRTQPGVVNNRTGLSPDGLREALQQRGWFGEFDQSQTAPESGTTAKPGDSLDDLTALMRQEASGRANRVYHPTEADQQVRRSDLEDQMQQAGVGLAEPLPVASAKLAAWRAEQVKQRSPQMAALHQRADFLGVEAKPDATYDDLLADVLEREAIQGEASATLADHDEDLEYAEFTPDEHEWLSAAGRGAEGEPDQTFPVSAAGRAAGTEPAAQEGDLEHRARAGGGGEDAREGAAPDELSGRPILHLPKFQKAPVFYSAVERHVANSPLKAAPPEQWKATLKNAPGIKQEEMAWTGVGDWLDLFPKGEKVPKERLEAFLRENGVQVEEQVIGKPVLNTESPYYGRQVARVIERAQDPALELANDGAAYREIMAKHPELVEDDEWERGPQFEDWKLPGGTNYRELLLTLPKEAAPPATHWDTPGVMAHVRFDERTSPDGKKVLFVEEIQSDWHQKGRDQGYATPASPEEREAALAALNQAHADARAAADHLVPLQKEAESAAPKAAPFAQIPLGGHTGETAEYWLRDAARSHELEGAIADRVTSGLRAREEARLRLSEATQRYERSLGEGGIPDAPFKTSWPALVMKRTIRWAVDHGFDRIAWTTGEQQAERYDLTKHIGRVTLHDNSAGGTGDAKMGGPLTRADLTIHDPHGNRIASHHIDPGHTPGGARGHLEEIIGKELTERLLAAEPRQAPGGGGWRVRARHLEGLDVKTGGEGMKAFYDRNLVNITNDLIKKHGGKVGTVSIEHPDVEGMSNHLRSARRDVATAEERMDRINPNWRSTGDDVETRRATMERYQQRVEILERRMAEAERDGLKQHGFDITPQLAEAVSGGQPLFKRGEGLAAPKPDVRVPKGLHLIRDKTPEGRERMTIDAVAQELERVAPFAEVHPADRIAYEHDQPGMQVLGATWRDGLRHVIAWSLESPDALHTGRHEAIHALKAAGLFHPDEWDALRHAALADDWLGKHHIEAGWPDLRSGEGGPSEAQIEEAIAEQFGQWRREQHTGLSLIDRAFNRLRKFLDHAADLARTLMGAKTTAPDVFSRVETGMVGRRMGDPAAEEGDVKFARTPRQADRDARQAAAQREIDEAEGRAAPRGPATFINHALGQGVDAVGARVARAADRFLPDATKDVGADIRLALNPMAAGTPRAQAEAKDFANGMREIAWSHGRVDKFLADTFTREERQFMYDAADEERVMRGRGQEPGPGEGKSRLPANLRAVVDELQARADDAFTRAQALGMVKGDGQQSYVPAMLVDVSQGKISRLKGGGPKGGGGLTTSTGQLRQRKHETAAETQAAAQRGFGEGATVVHDIRTLNLATGKLEQAMAGRRLINKIKEIGREVGEVTVEEGATANPHETFTMPDQPAMVTWGLKLTKDPETGKWSTVNGPDGAPVMEAHPLYISKEFEGPLKAVLSKPDAGLWRSFMDLKGKMMSVTMYNPLLHNMVIYGKAFPAMIAHDKLGAFTFKTYRDGHLVKTDPALMARALQSGTVPIGHRGAFQDITSIASEDSVAPGRSWTAQLLAATLGAGSEARKTAIKEAVDKAGDVWHNEFLWNRVADLQMGLWKAMTDHFQATGMDQTTADRTASHFANMYAGSVPSEAMSNMARGVLNGVLFSRSFHVTNLGGLKAVVAGLPTDVQAQILRDAPAMLDKAQGATRQKAIMSLVTDQIAAWSGRMLAAGAMAWLLSRPFQAPSDNEPNKTDRVFVGYGPDGTASYMRLPFGKYIEEVNKWFTEPLTYAKQIMFGPTRLALQILSNDMGFGRKVYDDYDKSLGGLGKNTLKIAGLLAASFIPVDQAGQLWDMFTGKGQVRADAAASLAGNLTGFTISHGAPGGPAVGDIFRAQDEHQYQVAQAMPDIRKQIKAGDIAGAQQKMKALGIAPGLQAYYIRVARNPGLRLSGRKLADFNRIATPEQKAEFARDRAAAAARRVTATP